MTDVLDRDFTFTIDTVGGDPETVGQQAAAAVAAPGRLVLIAQADSEWRGALIDVIAADIVETGGAITWVHNPGLPEVIEQIATGRDLIVTGCLPGIAAVLRARFGAAAGGGKIVCDIRPQTATQTPGTYTPPADDTPLADSPEN